MESGGGGGDQFLQERLDTFRKFVKTHKSIIHDLKLQAYNEARRLEIASRAVSILCELLLGKQVIRDLKKYLLLLLHFTYLDEQSQLQLLYSLEEIIILHEMLPQVPQILNFVYFTGLVEKENLCFWFNQIVERSEEILQEAKPFIEWLVSPVYKNK